MKQKRLIAVSGSNGGDDNLTPEILGLAEEVGRLIAEGGGILLCGGLSGIMEASAKGAQSAGGLTVGILPRGREQANRYIDVPIATNLGYFRNSVLVSAADAMIAICGRWGTMNEISMAVALGKPTILLSGSGGFAGTAEERKAFRGLKHPPVFAHTPSEAVGLAFRL